MPKTFCPDCDAVVTVASPQAGAMVRCRQCDAQLEIISVRPFEVDFPIDEWDDDSDDEEEEEEDEED